MHPQAISEYESWPESTQAWSTGTTGTSSGSFTDRNCLYYFYTTTNQQVSSAPVIMEPIRWTIAAPASNGGQYDHVFSQPLVGTRKSLNPFGYPTPGLFGVAETLLPSGSHGEWQGGFAVVAHNLQPKVPLLRYPNTGNSKVWVESNLSDISASTDSWASGQAVQVVAQIAAIRHRVNGSPVGSLILDPGTNPRTDPNWRVAVSPDDTYEIDVWYRIFTFGLPSYPPIPGKACVYFATTQLSDSTWVNHQNYIRFENTDWSPSFNYREQTYSVTVSGHTGWTLKDGSDGPHKMISGGDWAANIGNGAIVWYKNTNNGHIRSIRLVWDREVAHVVIDPGPLMSLGNSTRFLAYRAANDGKYRSSVNAPAHGGTVTLASSGAFNQAGTTTFHLVDWTIVSNNAPDWYEGFRGSFLPSPLGDVPTSVTVTRVSQ